MGKLGRKNQLLSKDSLRASLWAILKLLLHKGSIDPILKLTFHMEPRPAHVKGTGRTSLPRTGRAGTYRRQPQGYRAFIPRAASARSRLSASRAACRPCSPALTSPSAAWTARSRRCPTRTSSS